MKTILLTLNSVKKHSVRYDCDEKNTAVTSIYVMKRGLSEPFPETIKITIEEVD